MPGNGPGIKTNNMWSYYGSKANIIDYYPKPKFDTIIEPFAGSARYALKYFDREVLLIDQYEVVVKIWKWLQSCSKNDILSLPRLNYKENLDNFIFDCPEAKLFMGFIIGYSNVSPLKTATSHNIKRPNHINYSLNRVANNLDKIRHWKIKQDTYLNIDNIQATYFIDPPYQYGGEKYVKSNKNIDFQQLSQWAQSRTGQVIVCENHKADWMPFSPLCTQRGAQKNQKEVIWTNSGTYQEQLELFK